jgi:pimeloyl-ACP methyl ester carboxylesterase
MATADDKMASDKMDAREVHHRIPSDHPGLSLFLRHLPPAIAHAEPKVVLYVHGGTFPSALSIAHRFDGRSWRDELAAAGFDVWGFDFHGFGCSDRYPAMREPADAHPPLCTADDASRQIERAVRFVATHHGVSRISIIAHSWGTIATGRFAGRCPDLVDRLVLFGPIARRDQSGEPVPFPASRNVSLADQWSRFTAEVPAGDEPVLRRRHFDDWGERYLDSDPESRTRTPPAVKTPAGPWRDIAAAWAGELAYDPALVRAPVAIIRGEWDSLCTDADARWLFDAFSAAPMKRDVKLGRATHLAHLEEGRHALYREAQLFLEGGDAPQPGAGRVAH